MGRWHREGCKRFRDLALRILLASVLLCICFGKAFIRCDAKTVTEQDAEASTTVTAYVSMEPEKPSDSQEEPGTSEETDTDPGEKSENDGRNAKTGDQSEIDNLIYLVIGSFSVMMCGILILCVDKLKEKEDEC